ncbi:MAG: M24 family metallopeptidase [Phycisphaerales bacterium JB050]
MAKPQIATSPHADRLKRLRSTLKERSLDALLITNPADIHYLTGFRGEDSYAIVSTKQIAVVSDFRFSEELGRLERVKVVLRSGSIAQATADYLNKLGSENIGLQAEYVTLAQRDTLVKALGKGGAKRLRNTSELMANLRLFKTDDEIKSIRKAVKIQQDALVATLETIRPGQTELEVCARLEYEMKTRGSEKPAFGPIVAAQANGSLPHAVPGKTKIAKGKPLLIDWGCTVDGYRSDMTRTFSIGTWSKKMREIYTVTREAFLAAIDAVQPGMTGKQLDAVARDHIAKAGYGEAFGHSLGHGIGLDVHEGPRVAKTSDTVLEPGMVITIEPGIYLPGVGGVRIENDILVTPRGGKDLCSLPTDMEWATI